MSKYLDIPLDTVERCIEYNNLIHSVFRDDDVDGSMGITYNKHGRLKVRDFGGFGFFEDVYGVVAYVLSIVYERPINPNNKQDFYFILKHIYRTFADIIANKEHDYHADDEIKNALMKSRSKKAIIEIAPRAWNKGDKEVWNRWNISLNYLNTHFVLPVEQYYINRASGNTEPKYRYKTTDPCYAYILGQNRQGICLIKLYFPLRNRHKQVKFVTNCNVLEGLVNLEMDDYDYIIITKSTKDRLSLGNHLDNNSPYGGAGVKLKIGVINLPSENYRMKQVEYDWLKNKLKEDGMIISFLDFDRTGRDGADYLLETYNIPYIFITRGEFGLEDYGCKDFSDLHDVYSNNEIDNFIKQTITYVELRYKGKGMDYSDASERKIPGSELPY